MQREKYRDQREALGDNMKAPARHHGDLNSGREVAEAGKAKQGRQTNSSQPPQSTVNVVDYFICLFIWLFVFIQGPFMNPWLVLNSCGSGWP